MIPDPSHVAAGALTGFVVGLTGVGGGALMTPILLLLFGVAPAVAIQTDLWFAALTKAAVTPLHYGRGLIDWPVLRRLWIGSLPASVLTILWLRNHRVDEGASRFLTGMVAAAVCLTAIAMLFQRRTHSAAPPAAEIPAAAVLTAIGGALIGILITLTSVGAGAIGVVLLARLYPARLTPPRLVATDIAQAIPLTLFAAVGHTLISDVDLSLLAGLLIGSIPAALLGARWSSRLPHARLRMALACVLLVIGIKLASTVLS